MEAFLVTVGSDNELEYLLMNDPLTRLEESLVRKEVVVKYYKQRRAMPNYLNTIETFLGIGKDLKE